MLDFYCPAERLAVELDGASHNNIMIVDYDSDRDAYLERRGIRVFRFENRLVFEYPEYVVQTIEKHFQ